MKTQAGLDPALPGGPGVGWRMVLGALARLPAASLSRVTGRLADLPIPRPLRGPLLGAFARAVGIALPEAERPLSAYRSLNHFFVRRLRPGLRPWPEDPDVLGSPVDGIVGQVGVADGHRVLQAKGREYSVAELLGGEGEARAFRGGAYLTLYLSPRHYHRIHAPLACTITSARHVPGGLLPVNAAAVSHVQDLFARNERVVTFMEGERGRVALVAVGAYNVGRISTAFDPDWSPDGWVTNRRRRPPAVRTYDPPIPVKAGEEIMAFHLGSTVVVIAEPGTLRILDDVRPGREVRLGTVLAQVGGGG